MVDYYLTPVATSKYCGIFVQIFLNFRCVKYVYIF